MEIGDDEEGNAHLIFHTTREEIKRLKTVPFYKLSLLTIETITQENHND